MTCLEARSQMLPGSIFNDSKSNTNKLDSFHLPDFILF